MACTSNVAAIDLFCGAANAPGLDRKLYITTGAKVDTIPAATAHVIATDITMVTSQVFYGWNFSKDESSYTCTQDENGMWLTEIKIFVEKLQAATTNIMVGMNGDSYIALVNDRNSNMRLIGTTTNGCTVRVKEQTSPRNGYEVTITWESPLAPYFYTGAIAE